MTFTILLSDQCEAGRYRSSTLDECTQCETNMFSEAGAAQCESCGAGTVVNQNQDGCGEFNLTVISYFLFMATIFIRFRVFRIFGS